MKKQLFLIGFIVLSCPFLALGSLKSKERWPKEEDRVTVYAVNKFDKAIVVRIRYGVYPSTSGPVGRILVDTPFADPNNQLLETEEFFSLQPDDCFYFFVSKEKEFWPLTFEFWDGKETNKTLKRDYVLDNKVLIFGFGPNTPHSEKVKPHYRHYLYPEETSKENMSKRISIYRIEDILGLGNLKNKEAYIELRPLNFAKDNVDLGLFKIINAGFALDYSQESRSYIERLKKDRLYFNQ